MNKTIEFIAPELSEKDACTALGHFLEWRIGKVRKTALFKKYCFKVEETKHKIKVEIYKKEN